MTRNRSTGVLAAALVLSVLSGALLAGQGGPSRRGKADLRPIDESGIKARIVFVDDGTTLTVTGIAAGLDPAETYLTLIYDNGSTGSGLRACQPTIFDPTDPDFLLATMFVGFWTVDSDGFGILEETNTNGGLDFVPLSKFRNVSVRRVIGPPSKGSMIPVTKLVACGSVAKPTPPRDGRRVEEGRVRQNR